MNDRPLLPPGAVLRGRYEIEKVIGVGGFGNAYLALDPVLQCTVAIKEYRENINRFLTEARITAGFRNVKGIVYVYDFFEEYGAAYIVMEYLEGETLKTFLTRQKCLAKKEAVRIISEVLVCLTEIHKQGVLHRDIAPDNIFLLKDGSIRLFDFGCAVEIGKELRSVEVKRFYSPPEQYCPGKAQTESSDVYSAAATFVKMLTGTEVPPAPDRRNKGARLPKKELQKKAGPKMTKVICRALSMDPKKRPKNAEVFLRELKKAQKGKREIWGIVLLLVLSFAVCGFSLFEKDRDGTEFATEEIKSETADKIQETKQEEIPSTVIRENMPETETETEKETQPWTEAETEAKPLEEHETLQEQTTVTETKEVKQRTETRPSVAEPVVDDPGGW